MDKSELYWPANAPMGESNAVTLLREWRRAAREGQGREVARDDGSMAYHPLNVQLENMLEKRRYDKGSCACNCALG
jgi:hypothetical protein